jgi:hypothetical protein
MIVSTPTASTFTAQCWIENGGAAIAVDSSPNSVAPAANRIIRAPSYAFNLHDRVFQLGVVAFVADGTGATLRMWWYDDVQLLWIARGQAVSVTYAGTNSTQFSALSMPGAKWFCQVTANTGVTKIAFMIR